MANENLGAGIYLDEYLDFDVDETGDLRAAFGTDELQKDLSIQMIFELDQYRGSPPTKNTRSKVASDVIELAELDPRVEDVPRDSISVSFSDDNMDLFIDLSVITESGEQELVFEI